MEGILEEIWHNLPETTLSDGKVDLPNGMYVIRVTDGEVTTLTAMLPDKPKKWWEFWK